MLRVVLLLGLLERHQLLVDVRENTCRRDGHIAEELVELLVIPLTGCGAELSLTSDCPLRRCRPTRVPLRKVTRAPRRGKRERRRKCGRHSRPCARNDDATDWEAFVDRDTPFSLLLLLGAMFERAVNALEPSDCAGSLRGGIARCRFAAQPTA